jgi:hypothetical protein
VSPTLSTAVRFASGKDPPSGSSAVSSLLPVGCDTQLLHAAVERRRFEPQHGGGACWSFDAPTGSFEALDDLLALSVSERLHFPGGGCGIDEHRHSERIPGGDEQVPPTPPAVHGFGAGPIRAASFTAPASVTVCFNRYTLADSLSFVRSGSRQVSLSVACSADSYAARIFVPGNMSATMAVF